MQKCHFASIWQKNYIFENLALFDNLKNLATPHDAVKWDTWQHCYRRSCFVMINRPISNGSELISMRKYDITLQWGSICTDFTFVRWRISSEQNIPKYFGNTICYLMLCHFGLWIRYKMNKNNTDSSSVFHFIEEVNK